MFFLFLSDLRAILRRLGLLIVLLVSCLVYSPEILAQQNFELLVKTSGSGSITSDSGLISCGSDCSEGYPECSIVNLAAIPDSGYLFVEWQGSCTGSGTCRVEMSESHRVKAVFQRDISQSNFELRARKFTGGSIVSSPDGIDCGTDCTEIFAFGQTVEVRAMPETGFAFSHWLGDCEGTTGPVCVLQMTEELRAGAEFTEVNTFSLTVSSGIGGIVTSNPGGIVCGGDCTENYSENTWVSLSAISELGYEFTGWSGACSGMETCNVLMSEDQGVTATFTNIVGGTSYALTVVSLGGRVTSTPAGIDCGLVTCTETYEAGTVVSLSPIADPGFTFIGWSGACSGMGQCAVTMDTERNVTAEFSTPGGGTLVILDMGLHTVSHGEVFKFQPNIQGEYSICRKDLGHDDVKVDSETGEISWDTSALAFGRGFHIRIKCSSYTESAYASMVVHVDRSGESQLRVAGENGVSPYIAVAGLAMNSGDTIVFPDGLYPVSVTGDESFENAFKMTAPTAGSETQFSTIMARSPGGVVISGAAQASIPKQKNIFQFSETNYVALVGFVLKDAQRESLVGIGPGNHLLIDFVGAAGAGTEGSACSNFSEASAGICSKAGMRVNGGTPLFQHSYDWGHNRYGIMTRSTSGSVTRRSFVRLDEHKGDQPYGGFSNYCDTEHLSQDNTVFDSLAIAAPHYKNYAGLEAYPATGCENVSATLKTEGLLAVNNDLSLSLMDQKAGPDHIWDYIVSYDSEGTCTPQTNRCGSWLLQADKQTLVRNSYFGKARGFEGGSTGFAFDANDVILEDSVAIFDVPGMDAVGSVPAYLPESLLFYRGRSDTFYGDANFDQLTRVRRWPIGGEDIIAANMRSYDNPNALRVGGGTVHVNGDRGAVAQGESMSEYFWGYTNEFVPPLVVRVKEKDNYNRVAWEHLSGSKRDLVTGWKVLCASDSDSVLAALPVEQLTYLDQGKTCAKYGVIALYAAGESYYAYAESPVLLDATGEILLSDYRESQAPFQLSEFGNNGSGITWHTNLQQYLVVRNGAGIVYRYDQDFNFLGQITRGGNIASDMEGLSYVGGNQVMVVTEINRAHKAVIDGQTSVINGNFDVTPAYELLPRPVSNKGLEGVAVRPAANGLPARVYACQEGTGSDSNALMRFVYFDLPSPDPGDLMSYDDDLLVVEPFEAENAFAGVITDCSGMVYDSRTGHVVILSHESSKAIQIDPDTGEILSELSLSGAPQYEGVTFGPNGELVFASEPNWIHIFQR